MLQSYEFLAAVQEAEWAWDMLTKFQLGESAMSDDSGTSLREVVESAVSDLYIADKAIVYVIEALTDPTAKAEDLVALFKGEWLHQLRISQETIVRALQKLSSTNSIQDFADQRR